MNPLSVLYGAVSGARNALYENGLIRAHRLKGPVVSVGNISVGGSGKTPFIIMLGESDDRAGGVVIGVVIFFAALVVATATVILERALQHAVDMKSENDLTV